MDVWKGDHLCTKSVRGNGCLAKAATTLRACGVAIGGGSRKMSDDRRAIRFAYAVITRGVAISFDGQGECSWAAVQLCNCAVNWMRETAREGWLVTEEDSIVAYWWWTASWRNCEENTWKHSSPTMNQKQKGYTIYWCNSRE